MDLIYQAINMPVFNRVPEQAQRILDIGCGGGTLGRALKQKLNCHVTGITYSEQEATLARDYLDEVIVQDLNTLDTTKLSKFDAIICSHVLEHLYAPERLLSDLRDNLADDGQVIIALPNILHWKQRLEFLKGHFRYTEGGLMDHTHYRFYDWETSLHLIENSGLKALSHSADGYFPLPILRKLFPSLAERIDTFFVNNMPGFWGFQFITIAQFYK
jgi:SAM-dependent methyltransferase